MSTTSRTTGPPHFVGVGAQRAGTTWWFRALTAHPQVIPPRKRVKELHFFDSYCLGPLGQDGIAAYHERFPRRPGQVVGEWTPIYMTAWWVPRLLARAAPEAKLLVLLRDPIERYRSGIEHHLDRAPGRVAHTVAADSIERSRYASQLERLHRCFSPEQILVLQYERCRADPQTEYDRTLHFLGLDPVPISDPETTRGTSMAGRKDELPPDMRATLHRVFDPEVARLRALVPDLDLSLWPNFADADA